MGDHFSFVDNIRLIIILALFIVTGVVILYFRLKRADRKNECKGVTHSEERERRSSSSIEASVDKFKMEEEEAIVGGKKFEEDEIHLSSNTGGGPVVALQESMSIIKDDLECKIDKKLQDVFCKLDGREERIVEKVTAIMETRFQEILDKVDMGEKLSEKQGKAKTPKTKNRPKTKKQKPQMKDSLTMMNKRGHVKGGTKNNAKDGTKDDVGVVMDQTGREIDKREVLGCNEDFDINQFLDELEAPDSKKEVNPEFDRGKNEQ